MRENTFLPSLSVHWVYACVTAREKLRKPQILTIEIMARIEEVVMVELSWTMSDLSRS